MIVRVSGEIEGIERSLEIEEESIGDDKIKVLRKIKMKIEMKGIE